MLAKDLRRAWRNPWPWLLNLALPLCVTALVGLAFRGGGEGSGLGRIRFALVDEDDSPLTGFLRGATSQDRGGKYLEPVILDRAAALRQINDNQLSAVLIIPPGFTRHYLTGSQRVNLELIKNPAQSIHPAVLEELLGAVVTALNALSRNFQSEFPDWQAVFEGHRDYHQVAALIERAGRKLEAARQFVDPPLVSYEKPKPAKAAPAASGAGRSRPGPAFNLFAYLLIGMGGMFLLFLANNGMNDLHRELRLRTFDRYQSLRQDLWPFVAGKVLFTVVLLGFSALVLFGGGAVLFAIQWRHPLNLTLLTLAYAWFAAGLMAVLVALVPDERRANTLNSIGGMLLGLAGGCAFPTQQLPPLLRDHLSPLLPTFWFTESARALQAGDGHLAWAVGLLKLLVVSAVLIGLAAWLLRRRVTAGRRA
ncbi:MAG: ABC transporter permease [Verrucomicrobia bacterium]|nr:ABC transporter permease [Verrucomicrobiota bacterium]